MVLFSRLSPLFSNFISNFFQSYIGSIFSFIQGTCNFTDAAFNPILVLFSPGIWGIRRVSRIPFQSYIGSIFSQKYRLPIPRPLLSFNPILVLFSLWSFLACLLLHWPLSILYWFYFLVLIYVLFILPIGFQSYIGSIFSYIAYPR